MEPVDLSLKSPHSAAEINNNSDLLSSHSSMLLDQRLLCIKQLTELTNGVTPDRCRAMMKPSSALSFPAALLSSAVNAQFDELRFKKESQ
jgi:hypothetical protein